MIQEIGRAMGQYWGVAYRFGNKAALFGGIVGDLVDDNGTLLWKITSAVQSRQIPSKLDEEVYAVNQAHFFVLFEWEEQFVSIAGILIDQLLTHCLQFWPAYDYKPGHHDD